MPVPETVTNTETATQTETQTQTQTSTSVQTSTETSTSVQTSTVYQTQPRERWGSNLTAATAAVSTKPTTAVALPGPQYLPPSGHTLSS